MNSMINQFYCALGVMFFILAIHIQGDCQTSGVITYQEGKENCKRKAEENKIANHSEMAWTGPDCIIGAQIPEFYCKSYDSIDIDPQYFKGKLTIINFWYISCPPCIAEIPGLNAVVDKYGKAEINFIAIGIDDDKEIKKFLLRNPWNFDQISNGKILIEDYFKLGWGYPTTFILDREAKIISAFSGGKPDERAVDEVMTRISSVLDKELH